MNNPKDMLVSDPSALARELFPVQKSMPSWAAGRQRARQETAERTIEKLRPIYESELTKLRSERDELVGALRRMTDRASEIGQPAVDAMDGEDFHMLADAISMSREVLSKHKPE